MDKFVKDVKSFFSNLIHKNEYFRVFGIIFILGFIFFGTTALNNGFTMGFNGDYTLQTLAFYSDGYTKIWNFLKTGEFPMFDYSNFLGMNYFGTASFYYLTSPFYYILLLWPQKYIFQGVYFLLLIKYAFGGLFFYILLRKFFNYKERTCLIGAIAYAFSGWNLYYLWFHFADAMAVFPLLLMGIELCLRKNKGWLISVSLFVIALCNYFFFVTFAIFGVFYFLFRWISIYGVNKKKGYTFNERFSVAVKAGLFYIAGGLLGGFVLIPSLVVVSQSGRVDDSLMTTFLQFFKVSQTVNGDTVLSGLKPIKEIFSKENLEGLRNFLFVWPERHENGMSIPASQTLLYIVSNFLYMNVCCWDNAVFNNPGLDNNMGGLFISTFLGLLLVPSIINTIKEKKPWSIFTVLVCLVIPFLPITFYLFHGFTYGYGRWEICLLIVCLIYVLKTFDDIENVNPIYLSIGVVINFALALYCAIFSYKNGTLDMNEKIFFVIAQLILIFVVYHLTFVFHKKKYFGDLALSMVVVEIFASTVITINRHGVTNYETLYGGKDVYSEEQVMINDIKGEDKSFYRIFNNMATRNYTNLPNALSYNGMSTFNSIYNQNNNKFIDRSDVWYAGGWSMGYHEKRPYFDSFVGVKYYIVDKNHLNNDTSYMGEIYNGKSALIGEQSYNVNIPFGYEKLETEYSNFDIYENKNFIELGRIYDSYIPDKSLMGHNAASYYETLYTKAAIIDEENDEDVIEEFTNFNMVKNYVNPYIKVSNMNLKKSISMRNDFGSDVNTRDEFEVDSHIQLVKKIASSYGNYGTMMHGRWQDLGYFGDQIILEPKNGYRIGENATNSNPVNVIVNMQMGPQTMISLYGENDKLLTQDCHMYHNYSLSSRYYERKMERSFFVNEEVKKIVIEFMGDAAIDTNPMFSLDDLYVSYRYYEDYLNDLSYSKTYALENIESTSNTFKFQTNYAAKKIVCLNVPYDQGWSLTCDGKDKDIIRMNGGFIGFIAESGSHDYYLSYSTPGMKQGALISLGGLIMGGGLLAIYNLPCTIKTSKMVVKTLPTLKKGKGDDEEEEIDVKRAKKVIKFIKYFIRFITPFLLISLLHRFIPSIILLILGSILGYVISYFVSEEKEIKKYLENNILELGVLIILFIILMTFKIYPSFNFVFSFILGLFITKLLNKYIKIKL